jgi:hypothetical protein
MLGCADAFYALADKEWTRRGSNVAEQMFV